MTETCETVTCAVIITLITMFVIFLVYVCIATWAMTMEVHRDISNDLDILETLVVRVAANLTRN